MPGPPPTPTNLRILRGNPARRPIRNEPMPTLPPAPPEAPEYLTGYAREEWERIVNEMFRLRLLTIVDIHPLAAYCQAYDSWRTAIEKLKDMAARDLVMSALVVKTRHGSVMQNPLFLTARQSANDMLRYAAEFGFTPAARARIASGGFEPPDGSNKFTGLLA